MAYMLKKYRISYLVVLVLALSLVISYFARRVQFNYANPIEITEEIGKRAVYSEEETTHLEVKSPPDENPTDISVKSTQYESLAKVTSELAVAFPIPASTDTPVCQTLIPIVSETKVQPQSNLEVESNGESGNRHSSETVVSLVMADGTTKSFEGDGIMFLEDGSAMPIPRGGYSILPDGSFLPVPASKTAVLRDTPEPDDKSPHQEASENAAINAPESVNGVVIGYAIVTPGIDIPNSNIPAPTQSTPVTP